MRRILLTSTGEHPRVYAYTVVSVTALLFAYTFGAVVSSFTAPQPSREEVVRAIIASPILALPTSDPITLTRALDYFFSVRDSIAVSDAYTPEEKSRIHTLYPEAFLRSLPSLEKARQQVILKKNDASVRTYHRTLLQSLSLYKKDIARVRQEVQNIPANEKYFFPYGYTTPQTILSALATLTEDARAAERAIRAQRLCGNLLVVNKDCTNVRARHIPRASTPRTLSQNERKVQEALSTLYAHDPRTKGSPASVVWAETVCEKEPGATVPFWVQHFSSTRAPEGVRALKWQSLGDFYYRDFRVGTATLYAHMKNRGYTAEHQIAGHAYICPDAHKDAAAIARAQSTGTRTSLSPHEYHTLLEAGSYDMASLITELGYENEFALRAIARGRPLEVKELLLSRSFMGILLQASNRTFVETEVSFMHPHTSPLDTLLLKSLLAEPLSKQMYLLNEMRRTLEVFSDPILR